jgi:KDZ transposase-like protein
MDTCVDRWRNAGPEARKKMFALFAVAGIFLAVCRHGHVLVICDMIRSGELYVFLVWYNLRDIDIDMFLE